METESSGKYRGTSEENCGIITNLYSLIFVLMDEIYKVGNFLEKWAVVLALMGPCRWTSQY